MGLKECPAEFPMGSPKKIFISYVEEDGAVAHEIAAGLESQGYSSWYYERDCPAGADYFEETFKAISDCEAMIVLISPRSLPSDQVTREIVRAVEASKATLPLLLEISHDDFTRRRPGWKQAMAAANATRIPPDRVPTIIPALVAGLSAKGIQAETNGHTPPPAAPPKQDYRNARHRANRNTRGCHHSARSDTAAERENRARRSGSGADSDAASRDDDHANSAIYRGHARAYAYAASTAMEGVRCRGGGCSAGCLRMGHLALPQTETNRDAAGADKRHNCPAVCGRPSQMHS